MFSQEKMGEKAGYDVMFGMDKGMLLFSFELHAGYDICVI
jgi:hypothetical protein